MRKWLKYDKMTILRDKSRDGLFVNFIRDYQKEFGEKVIVGCGKCLTKCYNKFYNKYTIMEVKKEHGYVLKLKYNAIKSKTNGSPCRNADLTEKQAIDLIENHPRGFDLFESIPQSYYDSKKEVVKKVVEPKENKKRTRKNSK